MERVPLSDAGRSRGPKVDEHVRVVTGGLAGARLRRVTEYIENNLHRGLRLAELCTVIHMSPYHFARRFKESSGVSPHRFVIRRRIDEAMTLLAAPRLPIGAIAKAVGFRTASHFATTFRHITGVTPSAYRTRQVSREAPPSSHASDSSSAFSPPSDTTQVTRPEDRGGVPRAP